MAGSPLERLTRAVLALDEEMLRLGDKAKAEAGDLVRRADGLAQELANDIDLTLYSIVEELKRRVEEEAERLRREYAQRKEEALRNIRFNAEIHMDEAVNTILEELRRILEEV